MDEYNREIGVYEVISLYNSIRSLTAVKALAVPLCSFVRGWQEHWETLRF